jgi:hypothetical protein
MVFGIFPYSIFVGLCYLWGYWSVFDINILQYAGITDVAASALYPMMLALAFISVGYLSSQTFANKTHSRVFEVFPPPEEVISIFRKHGGIIITLYVVCCALFIALAGQIKWMALPVLIAVPMTFIVMNKLRFAVEGFSRSAQAMTLFGIIFLPIYGFGQGKVGGEIILDGIHFTYLSSSEGGPDVPKSQSPIDALRFLGHAGEFDFFYDPKLLSVSVSKTQDDSILTFNRYRIPRPTFKEDIQAAKEYLLRYWKDNFP